jgi:peptide subunit release factor RF-3
MDCRRHWVIAAVRTGVAGFVFKVQVNISPQHRDRMALGASFLPLLARHEIEAPGANVGAGPGVFPRPRAQPRGGGLAGDIIGISNQGSLRIGNTLTQRAKLSGSPESRAFRRKSCGECLSATERSRSICAMSPAIR